MKNYYQWLSIDSSLTTKEIQSLIIEKIETVNQQRASGIISDGIYIEAINQLRKTQAVFNDEISRQQYDFELTQSDNTEPVLATKKLLKAKNKMEHEHQAVVNQFRLWQKLLIIVGIVLTFGISIVAVGLKPSLIFLAIALVSLLFVLIVSSVFRKFHFDKTHQLIKFALMFGLFIIWYYSLQLILNVVQLTVAELSQMGNILIYCLLGCLIVGLMIEWFIFQEEVKFEDALRDWLDEQNIQLNSKEDKA